MAKERSCSGLLALFIRGRKGLLLRASVCSGEGFVGSEDVSVSGMRAFKSFGGACGAQERSQLLEDVRAPRATHLAGIPGFQDAWASGVQGSNPQSMKQSGADGPFLN